jgi:hypothetical protein
MSLRSLGAVAVLAASAWCAAPIAWAQDSTVRQVYQAAEAGKFIEAQAMMDKVLRDHPNSGKAHFVEAELLARQGKFDQAGTELANAERLSPGLPFAKPEAVQELRTLVARTHPAPAARTAAVPEAAPAIGAPQASGGFPWSMILAIGGLAAIVWAFLRNKAASRAAAPRYGSAAGPGAAAGAGFPPYAHPGNAPVGPGMGAPGSGIGSGIVGGLATGAALGAGMVAGEALMHRFTDADRAGAGSHAPVADPLATPDPLLAPEPPAGYDMGGGDFGLSDPGSWDDGGGGDGDEWT